MVKKILFIEGTKDDTNGNLREGFHKLLEQKLKGNLPRIKMANGVTEAKKTFINNFTNKNLSEYSFLLIDLDDCESNKNKKIDEYQLNDYSSYIFFMIQEMEAWFLSQPNILDDFYNENISQKVTDKNYKEFEDPAEYLQKLTKNSKRKKYHKVKHGVELLKRLNAHDLADNSTEFKELIKQLQAV